MTTPKNTLRILKGRKLHPLVLTLREFLLDCQSRNLTPGTLRYYRQKLGPLLAYLAAQGVIEPGQVTPRHLRRFMLSLKESGHNPGGLAAHFRAMRRFFSWLQDEGEIAVNPTERLKAPRVPEETLAPASVHQVRAMLSVCERKAEMGARDYSLILALVDTGARAGEILRMSVGDADLTSGCIIIRRSKSRRPRVVFLGTRSLRALLSYLRFRPDAGDEAPLWTTRHGGRMRYTTLRDVLRRRAKQTGVEPPSLHSMRRLFATASLASGADLLSVARMLGHSNLATIKRYVRQLQADLQAVHKRHSPVDKMLGVLALCAFLWLLLRFLAGRG